jgi:hypothetical protein
MSRTRTPMIRRLEFKEFKEVKEVKEVKELEEVKDRKGWAKGLRD